MDKPSLKEKIEVMEEIADAAFMDRGETSILCALRKRA